MRADAREVPANRLSQGVWKHSTLMERHVPQNQSAWDRWALDRVWSIESLHPSLQFSYHSRLFLLTLFAYGVQWHHSNFLKSNLVQPKAQTCQLHFKNTDATYFESLGIHSAIFGISVEGTTMLRIIHVVNIKLICFEIIVWTDVPPVGGGGFAACKANLYLYSLLSK